MASVGVFGSPGDKWLIGLGMIPRGEVGLIFATIGLNEGILGKNLYAALLLVVLVTTLMTPPLLRWRLNAMRAGRRGRSRGAVGQAGRWLAAWCTTASSTWRRIRLRSSRSRSRSTPRRAWPRAPGRARASCAWIGEWSDTPLRWSPAVTKQLFAVLTDGDVRAWRFLETTGVLERALPELAEAVDRRRNDPFLLDPSQVLRFTLVERIREIVATDPVAAAQHAKLQHPEWLLLAALILDTVGDDSPVQLARRIAHRLDLGAAAEQQIALPRRRLGPAASGGPEGRRARRRARRPHRHPPRQPRARPVRSTC